MTVQASAAAPAPRPRSKRMRRSDRRAQLLGVAREIVRTGGFGALTMAALAEQSGASKPVVYEHFENSEAVAIALLGEDFAANIRHSVGRIGNPDTLFDYFDQVIDALFEHYGAEHPLIRSITNGFSASSEVNAFYLEQQHRALEVYRELLRQQGIDGEVGRVTAYALSTMIQATVIEYARGDDVEQQRATLKRLVEGVLRSVIPGEGRKPQIPTAILDEMANAANLRERLPRALRNGEGEGD